MTGKQLYLGRKLADGNIDTKLLLTDFDFDENQIIALLYDETTDILWMGSLYNGLFKISPMPMQITLVIIMVKPSIPSILF